MSSPMRLKKKSVQPLSPRKGLMVNEKNTIVQNKEESAKLILANGQEFHGYSFGADTSMAGEVVFNTGMVGYPEALTDPSYRGQILVLTYPLIGNYGVPDTEDRDELGLPKHFESDQIHIRGLIIMDYSHEHNHWNAMCSLGAWCKKFNVPALYGIDTRQLTKIIRETGVILGKIQFPKQKQISFQDPNKLNLVKEVSTKTVRVFNKGKSPRIVAYVLLHHFHYNTHTQQQQPLGTIAVSSITSSDIL
jgi:carbamoyl-phosphate synthase (ammonia)